VAELRRWHGMLGIDILGKVAVIRIPWSAQRCPSDVCQRSSKGGMLVEKLLPESSCSAYIG